jgi:hypothetical protein
MHSSNDLIDLSQPVCSLWENIPWTGQSYHHYEWMDNGSGVLDSCDIIALENVQTHYCWWHHVEDVTVTLTVELLPGSGEIYLEYEGWHDQDSVVVEPVCTWWHEIYPNYCNTYHLIHWDDNNGTGYLDSCDCVYFHDAPEEGRHVVDVGTGMTITEIGPSAIEGTTWGRLKALYGRSH